MKAWLRWSLWQLYLIFFWPSRFHREVEGDEPGQPRFSLRERAVYLLKISPWTVLASVLVRLVLILCLAAFGPPNQWWSYSLTLAAAAAVIAAIIGALGMIIGLVSGVAFGVLLA